MVTSLNPHLFSSDPVVSSKPEEWAHKNIGLLGGSFNPAHEGHIHLSNIAMKHLNLDAIWWLMSPQNPLKSTDHMASFASRFEGAVSLDKPNTIHVTAIEDQMETQYTCDTVKGLTNRFPTTQFVWLMGADNLVQFNEWKNWHDIAAHLPIAVIDRPTYKDSAMTSVFAAHYADHQMMAENAKSLVDHDGPAWVFLSDGLNPTSASELRQKNSSHLK